MADIFDELLSQGASPPTSTITGEAVPTAAESIGAGKAMTANAVRYVPPLVAGTLTKGKAPFIEAGISALSEAGARGIENLGNGRPFLENVADMAYGGGTAGAFDLTASGLFKGLGWAAGKTIKPLMRKALIPKEMSPLTEITQKTLAGFAADESGKPFTLTLGRLNGEERNFINWLESLPRAAIWGGGKMKKADLRNVDRITRAIDDYIAQRTLKADANEFAGFLKQTLGDISNPGLAFEPVETYRKFLYKQFDDIVAANPTATVDMTPVLEYAMKRGKDPRVREMLSAGRSLDLLPPVSVKQDPNMLDLFVEGGELIPGDAVTDATKEMWQQVPLNDADQFLKLINQRFKRAERQGDEAEKGILNYMRNKVAPAFKDKLSEFPEAAEYYNAAQEFYGAKERAMYNSTIKSLRGALKNKPSTVLNLFIGDAARADRLKSLKHALFFSAGVEGGKEAVEEMWDKSVLRPLRYNIITSAIDQSTGVFDSKKFLSAMDNLSKYDKSYVEEVFGSQTQVKRIRELAIALAESQSKYRDSVLIQLTQAGALTGVAGGAATMLFSDEPTVKKFGAGGLGASAAILVGPRLLASVLSNPTTVASLTEAVKAGPKSVSLARVMRRLATQYAASEQDYKDMSVEEFLFYNTIPEEQTNNPKPSGG